MTQRTRPIRRPHLALAALAGLLAATVAAPPAAAAPDRPATPARAAAPTSDDLARTPAPKRAHTTLTGHDSTTFVHVKFVEGSGVRLRDGNLVSMAGAAEVEQVRTAVDRAQASLSRLFDTDEAVLDERSLVAHSLSGQEQADLNLWYRLRLEPDADPVALIDSLNALSVVETAYPEPLGAPTPIAPDFSAQQGYRSPASASGVDADYARTVPGGAGSNVRVHDVEYSWNTAHEDLSKLRAPGVLVANGTPQDPWSDKNHGTGVAGVLAGDDNKGGVLGLAPGAQLRVTNAFNTERGYDLGTSITTAAGALRPGDVMLIEQQTWGPIGCGVPTSEFVAVEWVPAYYDAIRAATSLGIIVVEAAGNGSQNLDNACLYGSTFPSGRADSGAIIVGAGGAPGCSNPADVRSRLSFSTYGARVDLQGWGECVTTTGYGGLFGASENTFYTSGFNGTSSASPIVASSAAVLSSVAKERGATLAPRDVRSRLKATGTAQANPAAGNIGPLPNLRAAILALPTGNPRTASASVSAAGFPPSNGVDGDVATRWTTGVAQANGQFFQLDLGSAQTVNRIVLDSGSSTSTQYPRGWAVRVSSNGTTWSNPVATGAGSSRLTTIPLPATTARYVRVTQTGSSTQPWSIAEFTTG